MNTEERKEFNKVYWRFLWSAILSFIPFCYIYVIMIVYKLYAHHRMALFISFALSLTVIPVLWLVAHFAPNLLWYSYLIAYAIEVLFIVVIHRMSHLKFELKTDK